MSWKEPWLPPLFILGTLFLPVLIRDAFFYLFILIIFFSFHSVRSYFKKHSWIFNFVSGFFLGWISLIKFTFTVLALISILFSGVRDLVKTKAPPWQSVGFCFGFVCFWLLSKQPLSAIPIFFRDAFELSGGYTDALSSFTLSGDRVHEKQTLLFFAPAIIIALMAARQGWIQGLFVTGWMYMVFKGSFVRADAHALLGAIVLPSAALVIWSTNRIVLYQKPFQKYLIPFLALVLSTSYAHFVGRYYYNQESPYHVAYHRTSNKIRNIGIYFNLSNQLTFYNQTLEEHFSLIRNAHPILKNYQGTADQYSYNQTIVLSSPNLEYRPRPVIQSYSAYTPRLSQLNANHLKSPKAAEVIFFETTPIDNRLPSIEDGASWPELISRYRIDAHEGTLLALKRRERPLEMTFQLLGEQVLEFGQEWLIPENWRDQVLWVEIDGDKTSMAKAVSLLYKLPSVQVDLTLSSGKIFTNRLPMGFWKPGFVLSPRVANAMDFMSLRQSNWKRKLIDQRVHTLRLDSKLSPYTFRKNRVTFRVYAIDWDRTEDSRTIRTYSSTP